MPPISKDEVDEDMIHWFGTLKPPSQEQFKRGQIQVETTHIRLSGNEAKQFMESPREFVIRQRNSNSNGTGN